MRLSVIFFNLWLLVPNRYSLADPIMIWILWSNHWAIGSVDWQVILCWILELLRFYHFLFLLADTVDEWRASRKWKRKSWVTSGKIWLELEIACLIVLVVPLDQAFDGDFVFFKLNPLCWTVHEIICFQRVEDRQIENN